MCFNWCHKRNEKEKGLTIWLAKVKQEYEKSGGEEAECNKLTVKETPDKVEEVKAEKEVEVNRKNEDVKKEIETPSVVPAPPAQTPTEKIRHEWYQSGPQVSITIFAKGVPKEQAEVIIEEGNVNHLPFPLGLGFHTNKDFIARSSLSCAHIRNHIRLHRVPTLL
jgi:suppressor of G2 allele of SKP1